MNPIQKQTAQLIVSLSVSSVVGTALRAVTPVDNNLLSKVAFTIGSGAIAGLVSERAADQVIEDLERTITSLRTAFKRVAKK